MVGGEGRSLCAYTQDGDRTSVLAGERRVLASGIPHLYSIMEIRQFTQEIMRLFTDLVVRLNSGSAAAGASKTSAQCTLPVFRL